MEFNKNLLWEICRYQPRLVYVFECINNAYKLKITGDVSYF